MNTAADSTGTSKATLEQHHEFLNRKRFILLDGVRGLAILAVIWHHSGGSNPIEHDFFSRGYLGVDLFFVLSGFLITFLLLRERRRTNKVSLKKFYMRRILRIFPLYFAFLIALTTGLYIQATPERALEILEIFPYYFLYISNWAPSDMFQYFERSWSLAVEEQFYLIWPLLFAFLPLIRSSVVITLYVIVVTALTLAVDTGSAKYLIDGLLPFRTLLIGCLLAIILTHPIGYLKISNVLARRHSTLIIALLLLASIWVVSGPIVGINQLFVHLLMAAFLASITLNESSSATAVLAWRPLQLCGLVSYGMYILHGQLWGITEKLTGFIPLSFISESRVTFSLIFAVVSLCAALVSYYFFEKWFLSLKKNYASTPPEPKKPLA